MGAAKIVVIDDEQDTLEYCKLILADKYDVITEGRAEKALQLIKDEKPDLVIMDLRMPVVDGFKLFDMLKENGDTNKIPLLFITASTKDDDLPDKFWQQTLGCDGFLTKPFLPENLLAGVQKIFEKKIKKNNISKSGGYL